MLYYWISILDLSKAFNKVWNKDSLDKLESMDISGKIYILIQNYESERFQRVTLNG